MPCPSQLHKVSTSGCLHVSKSSSTLGHHPWARIETHILRMFKYAADIVILGRAVPKEANIGPPTTQIPQFKFKRKKEKRTTIPSLF